MKIKCNGEHNEYFTNPCTTCDNTGSLYDETDGSMMCCIDCNGEGGRVCTNCDPACDDDDAGDICTHCGGEGTT